jgi:hypothetical protein
MLQMEGWQDGGLESGVPPLQPDFRSRLKSEPGLRFSDSTLAAGNRRHADELFALVHDARNMVAALNLYCDLLEEPGVLTAGSQHYAGELRLVGGASRRLLDKLETFGYRNEPDSGAPQPLSGRSDPRDLDPRDLDSRDVFDPLVPFDPFVRRHRRVAFSDSEPIESLAEELLANQSLLSALVGPAVTLGLTHFGGARPIAMSRDDLTRVLVNLARNAAEAMPTGGHLQIALEENPDGLCLSFTDNGPGIPQAALEAIFSPGYSTNVPLSQEHDCICWSSMPPMPAVRSACAEIAASLGYAVQSTSDLAQARSLLRGHAADILLVNLPYGSHQAWSWSPRSSCCTRHGGDRHDRLSSVNAAVEAMRRGASDYLTKPFAVDELSAVLERAASTVTVDTESRQLREQLRLSQGLGAMIGRSARWKSSTAFSPRSRRAPIRCWCWARAAPARNWSRAPSTPTGPMPQAVSARRLRLAGADADRERALRLREGRLHRRGQIQGRPLRLRRGRHRLSG